MSKMMNVAVAVVASGVTLGFASSAFAYERGYGGFSINPGSFLNLPATTPPPGLYGSLVFNQTGLDIVGPSAFSTNGQPTHVDVSAPVEILTIVPGFNFLGGVYSAGFAQQENYNAQSAPQNIIRSGIHNSSITPISLGYKLGDTGVYAKVYTAVVFPDGTQDGPTGLGNAGVPFWTIRPGLGLEFQKGGFTFNNNLVAEYNTKNFITSYQTGTELRDEFTITKTLGRFTFGPAFAYIAQVTNDTSSKYYNYAINTNRYDQIGIGAIAGYDFGPVSLSVYGLQDVHASASGGTPAKAGGPETGVTTAGYSVYAQVSFRIPGIFGVGEPFGPPGPVTPTTLGGSFSPTGPFGR